MGLKLLFILLTVLSARASPPPTFCDVYYARLAGKSFWASDAGRFISELNKVNSDTVARAEASNVVTLASKIAKRFPGFAQRLAQMQKRFPSGEAAYETAIKIHHRMFLNRYRDQELFKRLVSRSLLNDLANRGAKLDGRLSGQANLRLLSRRNVERIIKEKSLTKAYEQDQEISDLVNIISIVYQHNTNVDKMHGDFLLSSKQIGDYGLDGGVNSQLGFNRDFMKNDDQVFFSLGAVNKDSDQSQMLSSYGIKAKTLDKRFAEENAWVSPYVMYPNDLADFARKFFGERYQDVETHQFGVKNGRTYEVPKLAAEVKEKLHQFDFTLSDYETVLKLQLGTLLYNLKKFDSGAYEGAPSYEETVNMINGGPSKFRFVMENLVEYPLGFGRFELKVPVAVPKESIIEI